MVADANTLLAVAGQAQAAGDWVAARSAYEAALAQEETPEALIGLGNALWWLQETEDALRCQVRAYAVFRRRRDPFQAAVVALRLLPHYGGTLGNTAAARGWLARAARLIDEFDLWQLNGWLLLSRAALATTGGDPRVGEAHARDALEFARRFPDADLELCAMSQLGGALMLMGKVEEGTALLDEAMAGALGGEGAPDTVVHASCVTIVCCSRAADVKRAVQWIRAAEEFNRHYGSPHLDAVCRTAYGEVLLATGRWAEAEAELQTALDKMPTRAEPVVRAQALAKLAELRLAQGRLEEAARLLEGTENFIIAAYASAWLSLARGDLDVAASMLRRRLRDVGDACLDSAPLVELLVEVEIERGAADVATTRARKLLTLGAELSCDVILARGERALGSALIARSRQAEAVLHLERALSIFTRLELPLEAARSRLLLARALAATERSAAVAEMQAALATFDVLGAARDADTAAAFLRSLGVTPPRPGPKGVGLLTRRELQVLALLGEGLSNRELAERLCVSRKTVEHHVASVLDKLELSGRAGAAAYAVRYASRTSSAAN